MQISGKQTSTLFPVIVPSYCSSSYCSSSQLLFPVPMQLLFPVIVPVPSYCSQLLFPVIVPSYCSQLLFFPVIVPSYCSQLLFFPVIVLPSYCSQLLFPVIVPSYCSQLLFPVIVPCYCSQLLFPVIVPSYCSQLLSPILGCNLDLWNKNQWESLILDAKCFPCAIQILSGSWKPLCVNALVVITSHDLHMII